MFILEVEKHLGEDWEIFSSGGGCYHAVKEFSTIKGEKVAVEVHWNGGASVYHHDDDKNKLAKKEGLYNSDDNLSMNYIELAYIKENLPMNYDDIVVEDALHLFSKEVSDEILHTMQTFTKVYDQCMLPSVDEEVNEHDFKRLKKLVEIYRNALVEISKQEEMKDLDGNWVPTLEMSIAINTLKVGKKYEKDEE